MMGRPGYRDQTFYDATLPCGHTVLFRIQPREGDTIWCVRCQGYRLWYGPRHIVMDLTPSKSSQPID